MRSMVVIRNSAGEVSRIMNRREYEREQRFIADWARYQRMECANREWQAAQESEV
jgi:hypothetical protein